MFASEEQEQRQREISRAVNSMKKEIIEEVLSNLSIALSYNHDYNSCDHDVTVSLFFNDKEIDRDTVSIDYDEDL